MLKLKDFDYVIFDKDLKKDIEKYCLKHYPGSAAIKLDGSVPLKVWIPVKAWNPNAIQDDRVLKMKIQKVTDTSYQRHLGDIGQLIKSLGKNEDKRATDAVWHAVQNANEKVGAKMGKEAQLVLEKHLKKSGDVKPAGFKFKYNRHKSGLNLVGVAANPGLAFAGAANAGVAAFGSSLAATGSTVAAGAKLIKSANGVYKRQNKTIEETIASINKTILALNRSIGKHPGNIKVPVKEEGPRMLSEWAGFNMKSIKKLDLDTKLLKSKAKVEVAESSGIVDIADEWYTHAKSLTRDTTKLRKSTVDLNNRLPKDPTVKKKIAELDKCMKKLRANTKLVKVASEHLTGFAKSRQKVARQLINTTIEGPGGLEERVLDFNRARTDIGWTAIPMQPLPALASLGDGSGAAGSPLNDAQKQMQALAGSAQSAGETAADLVRLVNGMLKIVKKTARD